MKRQHLVAMGGTHAGYVILFLCAVVVTVTPAHIDSDDDVDLLDNDKIKLDDEPAVPRPQPLGTGGIDLSAVVIEVDEDPDEATKLSEKTDSFRPVSMPTKLNEYDVMERDGVVTFDEMAQVTGTAEGLTEIFTRADQNGDGVISEDEFANAPWTLAGDVKANMDLESRIHYEKQNIADVRKSLQKDRSTHVQHDDVTVNEMETELADDVKHVMEDSEYKGLQPEHHVYDLDRVDKFMFEDNLSKMNN